MPQAQDAAVSKDYPEAAEVGYLVDDALDAIFQYLKLKILL